MGVHHLARRLLYIYRVLSSETATALASSTGSGQVDETIARYHPRPFPPEVAAFARAVVSAAEPPRPERARALLFAAAKLADFGLRIGLELDEAVLLQPSVIERFCISRHAGSPPTRRTLRSNLRFLAKAAGPLAPRARSAEAGSSSTPRGQASSRTCVRSRPRASPHSAVSRDK